MIFKNILVCWDPSYFEFKRTLSCKPIPFSQGRGFQPKRGVLVLAKAIPMYEQLPSEHDILRPQSMDDRVCLEDGGLIRATVVFDVSSAKDLGIKTRSRQLSTLYKVECDDFKKVLNGYIQKETNSFPSSSNEIKLNTLTQTIKGTVDKFPFEVEFNLKNYLANYKVDSGLYIKDLIYAIFSELQQLAKTSSVPKDIVEKLKLGRTIWTPTSSENQSGLYLIGSTSTLFDGPSKRENMAAVIFPAEDAPERGRVKRGRKPKPTSKGEDSDVGTTMNPSINFFAPFTNLPVSLTIVSINPEKLTDTATGNKTQPPGNFILPSFDVIPKFFKETKDLGIFTVIIEERTTNYTLTESNPPSPNNFGDRFVYSFHEDGSPWTRCDIQVNYFAAAFNEMLFFHIPGLHSSQITYRSLVLESYERKNWVNEGLVCRKGSLKKFDQKELPFALLKNGTNPSQVVNVTGNLMLTAEPSVEMGNFIRTNRFITCSAFNSQESLAQANANYSFNFLEKAFGSDIELTVRPFCKLKPAYENGTIVHVTNKIYFRGLVSNAGSIQNSNASITNFPGFR